MSLNYTNLVAQGRAKAQGVSWSQEELEMVLSLERERKLSRVSAAEYVRNGIMSLEEYDKFVDSGTKPLTQDEAAIETEKMLKERTRNAIGKKKSK